MNMRVNSMWKTLNFRRDETGEKSRNLELRAAVAEILTPVSDESSLTSLVEKIHANKSCAVRVQLATRDFKKL